MTVDLRSPVDPTDPAQFTAAERVDDGTNSSLLAGFIASFNHAYANVGVFTISYTATDKDGGLSTAVTKTTTVGGVQVITDPSNPTKTALVVGGTDGNDNIVVDKGTGSSALKVTINGVVQGTFSFSGSVFVFGQAGNDTITIVKQVDRNAFVYSGIGNDNISSGNGRTVMIGGDDNDTLTGGYGVDVLIGGIGADSLNGGNGDDLLIAGNTLHDDFQRCQRDRTAAAAR